MAHQLPNGSWRVLIRRKGHAPVDRLFATQRDARAFEAQQRERIAEARGLWSPAMTLAQAAAQYLASTLFSGKTAHSQATERTRLRPVLAALGAFSLESLENGQHIARYRDERARQVSERTRRRISADSVRLELAALAAVFRWAVENRIVLRNPLVGMHRPHGQPRKRRLFEHEETGLVATLFDRGAADPVREAARFFLIQREVGCRPGELATLRRADVDLAARAARFRDTKHRREDRIVHLTENAVRVLAEQLVHGEVSAPDSPFLFTTRSRYGGVPVPANFRHLVARLREHKIVDADFHAHAVRREYVSNAFENGLSHADVMRMTGHRSYAAVQQYNVSQNLHAEVRKRLDQDAAQRREQLLASFASALEIPVDDLKAFMKAHGAIGEGAPDFATRRRARLKSGSNADPGVTPGSTPPVSAPRRAPRAGRRGAARPRR